MSATLWMYDEGEDGGVTPCSRSVSLGTDLTMEDIENLQTEITELRKERDAKPRQITVGELKKEGLENAISPSLPCKSQPDSILTAWYHSNPGEDQRHGNPGEDQYMLPKMKEEPGLAPESPDEDQCHGNPGEDQHMLQVKEEPGVTAVFKMEPNCPQTHFQSHLCEPKLENVATVHKNEPVPIEITLSVHEVGLQHALHRYRDRILTESQGSDCDGGDQHTLQAPLKMCSVRLVDCRKILELNGNIAWGNLEGEPSQPSSDQSSMFAVQTRNKRRAEHLHDITQPSLANMRHSKHRKLHSAEEKLYSNSSYNRQLVESSGHGHDRSIEDVERSHRCSQCGRNFTTDFNLHRHLKLHTGEKLYRCTQCGKCFAQLFNLTAHQRIHTGEKPYQCSACGKCFSQASKLKTHKRIHTGEKPYICNVCGKGFSDSSTYHKHQRIHTGERPYACSVCGKCFGQSAHLLKHNISHKRKPYRCSSCGKNFSKPISLNKHMALHSGDSSSSQLLAKI